jgi:hypothetical protein
MPAKSYVFFFLGVAIVSMSLHYFVFSQLRRTLRKDFGNRATFSIRLFGALFLLMESPFFILFLRKRITLDPAVYTTFLFYPFTLWQAIMLFWAVILIPQVLYRNARRRFGNQTGLKRELAHERLKQPPADYRWEVEPVQSTSEA